MVLVVGQEQAVVRGDVDAVRASDRPLTPRAQERAVAVEDDDRVLAAVEDVDVVLRVGGHAGHLDIAPAGRERAPVRIRPVSVVARADRIAHAIPSRASESRSSTASTKLAGISGRPVRLASSTASRR